MVARLEFQILLKYSVNLHFSTNMNNPPQFPVSLVDDAI